MTQIEFEFHSPFEGIAARIVDRWRDYHAAHPNVYEAFERLADQLRRAGKSHIGAKALFERLRFDTAVCAEGEDFKIDNSMVAPYVRWPCAQRPEFREMFETRAKRAA